MLLTKPFEAFPDYIVVNGFKSLSIQFKHLSQLRELPHHHGDPFDRLLIAQAITEGLTIVSAGKQFQGYPVSVSW